VNEDTQLTELELTKDEKNKLEENLPRHTKCYGLFWMVQG
jgi:hypothetical protein